jgi:hypothetical protein
MWMVLYFIQEEKMLLLMLGSFSNSLTLAGVLFGEAPAFLSVNFASYVVPLVLPCTPVAVRRLK